LIPIVRRLGHHPVDDISGLARDIRSKRLQAHWLALELFEGEPEVGDGGVEAEVAFEFFKGGTRLGGDLGPDAIALAFGQ
jgi:hypothetical protein